MRGAMIYERANVARNARFIELFTAAAKAQGASLDVCMVDEIHVEVQAEGVSISALKKPWAYDFALVRAMRPTLSEALERANVRVFNSARVSRVCNDKRNTALYFLERGLPMLKTLFTGAGGPTPLDYPAVVKAARGCGGRQVYLCEDAAQARDALQKIAPDDAVAQPFLDAGGRDVRVYVLGGEIYQAMERYSDGGDFRSNFGLHGCARPINVSNEVREMALCAARGLDAAFVGVDFLFDRDGRAYLNEIEDAVGTRMLYQFTALNAAEDYMRLIKRSLLDR